MTPFCLCQGSGGWFKYSQRLGKSISWTRGFFLNAIREEQIAFEHEGQILHVPPLNRNLIPVGILPSPHRTLPIGQGPVDFPQNALVILFIRIKSTSLKQKTSFGLVSGHRQEDDPCSISPGSRTP